MSQDDIVNILQSYLCFVIAIAVHEAAHAWAAWKCGDDTSRLMGRITLNPIMHMELVGTVVLPLLGHFLSAIGSSAAGWVIGWGKPVPVNPANFPPGKRYLYGMYVALAGPASNILLALIGMIAMRIAIFVGSEELRHLLTLFIFVNLGLCFFNLLPIPPLDGSYVLRYVFNISDAAYRSMAQFGFIAVLFIVRIPAVQTALSYAMISTFKFLRLIVGLG